MVNATTITSIPICLIHLDISLLPASYLAFPHRRAERDCLSNHLRIIVQHTGGKILILVGAHRECVCGLRQWGEHKVAIAKGTASEGMRSTFLAAPSVCPQSMLPRLAYLPENANVL